MANFPVIVLEGAPYERGVHYGQQAKARIVRSVASYRELFGLLDIEWDWACAIARRCRPQIDALGPQYMQEIEGIAAGSGFNVDDILTLNARTEILPPSFPDTPTPAWLAAMRRGADFGECTAIAVLPERSVSGETLLAQNWDWIGAQREALVLLGVRDEQGQALVTLTEAGMLAKIGCSRGGLGVCLNILRSEEDGLRPGLPVHVLLRALLGCESVAEAERLARSVRCGASSNVLCADAAGNAASFELSPGGVRVVRPDGGTLCHTNHFLLPAEDRHEVAPPPSLSSIPRLDRALALAAARAKHGVAELKQLLRDESAGLLSICRAPDPSMPQSARIETVASVIMEPARGTLHIAPDLPSRVDYATLQWGQSNFEELTLRKSA